MKRLDQLRAKLAARTDVPGYEKNCDAIRAEIARIEAVHGKTEGNHGLHDDADLLPDRRDAGEALTE